MGFNSVFKGLMNWNRNSWTCWIQEGNSSSARRYVCFLFHWNLHALFLVCVTIKLRLCMEKFGMAMK